LQEKQIHGEGLGHAYPRYRRDKEWEIEDLDLPVEIAEDAVLDNIRLAKKGEAKFKVTMHMDKDLTGSLTVQDTWMKSKASVDFDGGRLLQTTTK
jgi:hypothetical protein